MTSPRRQPDVDIVLEPPVAHPNASPTDKEAMLELLAKGLLRGVIFRTDDCDATFERIRAAGGDVLQYSGPGLGVGVPGD